MLNHILRNITNAIDVTGNSTTNRIAKDVEVLTINEW